GVDALRQLVGLDLQRLQDAVDVDLDAGGLAGAIVDDADVLPGVRLERGLADDLEGVVRPGADDVRAGPIAFEPQVPAAMRLRVVHAGHDGARLAAADDLDPGGGAEGLVLLEVAGLRNLQGRSVLDGETLGRQFPVNPGEARIQLHRT